MSAIVTNSLRIDSAQTFKKNINGEAGKAYYFYFAKPLAWENEPTPDPVLDNFDVNNSTFDEIIAFKKIRSRDFSLAAKRYNWTSGTIYQYYDDKLELFDYTVDTFSPFYVYTSDNSVYKCLWNGSIRESFIASEDQEEFNLTLFTYNILNKELQVYVNNIPVPSTEYEKTSSSSVTFHLGLNEDDVVVFEKRSASTEEPSSVVTDDGDQLDTLSDGYRWKYMGKLFEPDVESFLSTNWIPVRYSLQLTDDQYDVQLNANNGIDTIKVLKNGVEYDLKSRKNDIEDYSSSPTPTVELDSGASSSDDYYNGMSIYINGEIRRIVDYIGATREVILDAAFDVSPSTSDEYEITPSLDISSNSGSGLIAYIPFDSILSGKITEVLVLEQGSGYIDVDIFVNTPGVGAGSGAEVAGIISPRGGHGFNMITEVGGSSLITSTQFRGTENGVIPATNDFRKTGLIKDIITETGIVQDYDPSVPSITLETDASTTNNFYNGKFVKILSGAGMDESIRVTSYNGGNRIATLERAYSGTLTEELLESNTFLDNLDSWTSVGWLYENRIFNPTIEDVVGTKDGVNENFTISFDAHRTFLVLNGIVLIEGVDFTKLGTAITMVTPPESGDVFRAILFGLVYNAPLVEMVTGTKDGVNDEFSISVDASTLFLVLNGIVLTEGIDFTRIGSVITMVDPPESGDTFVAIIFGVTSDFAGTGGFARHEVGETDNLVQTIPGIISGREYIVEVSVVGRNVGSFDVSLGSVSVANGVTSSFTQTIITADNGSVPLTISPTSDFDGGLDYVSVKLVTIPERYGIVANDSVYPMTTKIQYSSLTGSISEDDLVTQGTSGATGVVVEHDIGNSTLYLVGTSGTFDNINAIFGDNGTVTVPNVTTPEIIKYLGDIVITEHRVKVERDPVQIESYKIIIEF